MYVSSTGASELTRYRPILETIPAHYSEGPLVGLVLGLELRLGLV